MISPGSSAARLLYDRHSGASADQGQGRRNRRRRAASADHSREQPRSTAASATTAAATAAATSKTEQRELPSLDLHHLVEREGAPRRHTAQTA